MVKSKYSFYTYAGVFFGIAALILLVIFSITNDVLENAKKTPLPKIIGVSICILLILYALYKVFKTSPQLTISENGLKIAGLLHKKQQLSINEISEIDLFAFGSNNSYAITVTKIKFVHGKCIKLAAINYKNISDIKLAFIKYFPKKIKQVSTSAERIITIQEEIKFSGNPYVSFNAILIYGLLIGFSFILATSKKTFEPAHLFIIPLPGFLFFGLAYQLHYFIFTDDKLIVKNHFLPWVNKQYDIQDIIALNFENQYRRSYSLRITTNDYKSFNFYAGSLRDKTWGELKEYFKDRGIPFID